jgi:hypothetical protein
MFHQDLFHPADKAKVQTTIGVGWLDGIAGLSNL